MPEANGDNIVRVGINDQVKESCERKEMDKVGGRQVKTRADGLEDSPTTPTKRQRTLAGERCGTIDVLGTFSSH